MYEFKILSIRSAVLATLTVFSLVGLAQSEKAEASGSDGSSYPYDPVCPWGRLSDGQGMLSRCIEEAEAKALLGGTALNKTEPAKAPADTPAEGAPEWGAAKYSGMELTHVDSGTLPLATKKLGTVAERYGACVNDNGGMQAANATVQLKFLVRESGRAEGIAVESSKGVNPAAAKCIAEVVDRRFVGYPTAPVVGVKIRVDLVAGAAPKNGK